MVVIKDGQKYIESMALLKVMQHLGLPFCLIGAGYLMPRLIRDFLYRQVALNLYQLLGKTDYCQLRSAENKQHVLEETVRGH